MKHSVYGIGNPLIDILSQVNDEDLANLSIPKGIMSLIDLDEREKILSYIENKEKEYSCGGSCPNTMITLSALGAATALGGKTGNDEYGKIYEKQLIKHENITSALRTGESATGSSIILITPDGERSMNTYLGSNREFNEADVDEQALLNSSFFYFTGYMWDTDNQKAAIMKSLDICRKKDIKVAFDVADPFAVGRYKEDFIKLIEERADIVFANSEEAKILFNSDNPEKNVNILSSMNTLAAVKNGKKGSFLKDKKSPVINIPILNDNGCLDTTGAGDTYAAGFLYGIVTGKEAEKAGEYASIAASAIVSKIGAQFTENEIAGLKSYIK